MDIQRAAEILEIELIKIVDQPFVKKQYHKLALQYHPDKNVNTPDCNIKFQQINEAYNYLKEMNEKLLVAYAKPQFNIFKFAQSFY